MSSVYGERNDNQVTQNITNLSVIYCNNNYSYIGEKIPKFLVFLFDHL